MRSTGDCSRLRESSPCQYSGKALRSSRSAAGSSSTTGILARYAFDESVVLAGEPGRVALGAHGQHGVGQVGGNAHEAPQAHEALGQALLA